MIYSLNCVLEPPGNRHPPPPGADTPEETPLGAVLAGRYRQQAGGTHPTGMHICFNDMFEFARETV